MMTPEQMRDCLTQIGTMTVMAISGGRVANVGGVLVLPVSNGYRVEIDVVCDTYTVRRVFRRKPKGEIVPVDYPKGERTGVYCDDISKVAYYASCFRSYDETEWVTK